MINVTDAGGDGASYQVRVPHEHRRSSIGWHDRDRYHHDGGVGILAAEGDHGVTVMGENGDFHRVRAGRYKVHKLAKALTSGQMLSMVPEDLEGSDDEDEDSQMAWPAATAPSFAKGDRLYVMSKAKRELKSGQRWITVHPRGSDEKGVPVLIEEAGDGTHRIIAGAGGKLTHLRLKNVGSPEEHAEKAKERGKERSKGEKERKDAQSGEERAAEQGQKADVEARKLLAERDFVNAVRDKAGGVSEDLDESRLDGLSKGARSLVVTRHHKKQLREAIGRKDKLAKQLLDDRVEQAQQKAAVQRQLHEETPAIADDVMSALELELGLREQEQKERREERRAEKLRVVAGKAEVGRKAAAAARENIQKADPTSELQALGGRDDVGVKGDDDLTASEEIRRRSLQAMQDAKILVAAAEGEIKGDVAEKVVELALERAGVGEDATPERRVAALEREAARQARRSEVQEYRADKYKMMELGGESEEEGKAKARAALAFTDRLTQLGKDAGDAKRMGLTNAEQTPLQEAEVAEIMDLMADAQKLRVAQQEFRKLNKAAETGDYDKTRRAFDLKISSDVHDRVVVDLEDEVRRELTERLLGVANPKRSDHMSAVANGHYASLADVSLGVAGQRYVDRTVVDAVGLQNASVLMRHAMEQDGHAPGDVLAALEDHHVGTLKEITANALETAESYVPGFEETIRGVDDIELAMQKLDVHEQNITEAQRAVGAAIGRMEATATASQAFRQKIPDSLQIDTKGQHGTALQWMHAAGLQPGDYHLNYEDGTISIPRASWDKLIRRDDASVVEARKTVSAIKGGGQDQDGWLPEGLHSRTATSFSDPVPEASTIREPLDLSGGAAAPAPAAQGGLFGGGAAPAAAPTADPEPSGPNRTEAYEATYGEQPAATTPGLFGEISNPLHEEWSTRRAAIMSGDEDAAIATLGEAPGPDASALDRNVHEDRVRRLRAVMLHPHGDQQEATSPPGGGLGQDEVQRRVLDHVGSRLADGERPHEIMGDLLSPEVTKNVPDLEAHVEHVKTLFPMFDEETGKAVKYEQNKDHFQGIADEYMMRKHGDLSGQFHAQDINVDHQGTHEAMFRALAKHPEAKLAFKGTGELTPQDRNALRNYFHERMGIDPKTRDDAERYKSKMQELGGEPQRERQGLFGMAQTPEWTSWNNERKQLFEKHQRAGLDDAIKAIGDVPNEGTTERATYDQEVASLRDRASKSKTAWQEFVQDHSSLELATRALQDEIKGKFVKEFADNHGRLTGTSLRTGVQDVANSERHEWATADADEREKIRGQRRSVYARIQARAGGAFAAEGGEGAVRRKYTEWMVQEAIDRQNQGNMFTAKADDAKGPQRTGERHTIGDRAEAQLKSLMPQLGRQFEPGKKIGLFAGMSMDGERIHQQRVIKMMDQNGGRLGAWLGTGAGKSATSIGAFTNALSKGKAKQGLYVVPSAVQDQFGAEMLKFTKPGQYAWKTGAGKNHDERVDMLRGEGLHMKVMTHQAYRDTVLKLMQDHHGVDRQTMLGKMRDGDHKERAQMMRDAMDANGIGKHFVYWDEAHGATHRQGTEQTGSNLIMQATTHPTNADQMLLGTATPHKNDTSEMHSMAATLDPERYSDRHDFMQQFGHDIEHAPDAIRRELDHLTYSAKIPPTGVERYDSDNPSIVDGQKVANQGPIKLEPAHQELVDRVGELYHRVRRARDRGGSDVEAMKELSPGRFKGAPEHEHEGIARDLSRSLGIIRESAMRRAINQAPVGVNTKLKKMADVLEHDVKHGTWHDRKTGQTHTGKPSIVFTDSLAEAKQIHEHLESRGLRSALYHGGLNSKDREKIRTGFHPEDGSDPKHDIVVATSAAEAGINMQRGKVIHHYDVPLTEKSHNQRSGRAYRQGQVSDVDVHNWHTDTEYDQRGLSRLRRKGGLASVFQTPLGNMDDRGIAASYHRVLAHRHQDVDTGIAAK